MLPHRFATPCKEWERFMSHTTTLGDYTLIRQIGQGSLGTVFLAEHRFLKRQFALKILTQDLGDQFISRFEKEVADLALLDHPHIVKIHNVSFADGKYYLVSDCICSPSGETTNLAQYLKAKENDLSENEVLKMLNQIAAALDYAHEKQIDGLGMVHLGIKLNNLLLRKEKEAIHIYLSDFGLSRILGAGAVLTRIFRAVCDAMGEVDRETEIHRSFLQNFAFLSPEQKRLGYGEKIDIKTDVYAFGVLAYYLLMREFPEGVFTMPSERFPNYRLNWNRLVDLCLQSSPSKRPTSLKSALEELLEKKSVSSKQPLSEIVPSLQQVLATKEEVLQPATKTADSLPRPILKPQEIVRPEFEPDPGAIFQTEVSVARYEPKKVEVKNSEPLLTEMAVISGGTFLRGSNNGGRDELPRHAVHLHSFAIDIHPVTNEQFVRFLEAMGGEKDANNSDIIRLRESRIKRSGGKLSIESGYAKHPVVGVAWYGAVAYAKWVGKRLPTEAEWEVAASCGIEENIYPTGKNIERSQANFFSSDTTAVMSYPPNEHGIYDMAGNVYDWCQDWYGYHYYDESVQEPDNPKGPLQGVYRILRGGCWKSLKEDLRCSHRHRNNPGTMNGTYGFRCAADVSF